MFDRLNPLDKVRSIANYQFGKDAGRRLFPDEVKIVHSKRTGKIRHVYLDEEMLATLRPTNGLFSLTIKGAKRIMKNVKNRRLWVKVQAEAEHFVVRGKSVFAKHVVDADEEDSSSGGSDRYKRRQRSFSRGKSVANWKRDESF